MSSTESSYKFDERKSLVEARAKLAALVGMEKAEEICQKAVSDATRGADVDDAAVIDAIERAYDHEVRRESVP
jgi:hypothetical protein